MTLFHHRAALPGPDPAEVCWPAAENYLHTLNREILNRLQVGADMYVSNAVLEGTYVLRACIVNFRTCLADMDALIEIGVARQEPLTFGCVSMNSLRSLESCHPVQIPVREE